MFLGRKKELRILKEELARKEKSAILIYGRRRIGKTTLIKEALKSTSCKVISFTAVPDELSENARRLSKATGDEIGLKNLQITDFEALLGFISSLTEQIVLVIDEYQDLRKKAKGEVIDAYFRDFIDKATDNIKVIISGSAIRVMKDLLQNDNPLYKRFTLEIPLGELDYLESSLFYPERSIREKIALYAVFGGIPMILSRIRKDLSVEDNIRVLLLDEAGFARTYTEDILYAELKSTGGAYSAIVRIGNGKKSYSEIASCLDNIDSRNSLDYTLEQLQKADFIIKRQPINSTSKRKAFYELKSNILRFHLSYIEKNPNIASTPAFFGKYVKPSFNTFVSYRFEEIARRWFALLVDCGIRNDIVRIGAYWYDDKNNKRNGEFDVALETLDGYEVYDVKYLEDPMSEKLIKEESEQARAATGIAIAKLGFISSSGFEKNGENRIDGSLLYKIQI